MARAGLLGLSLPSYPIRNLRDSTTPIRPRVWRRTRRSSTNGGGPGLCPRRPSQGLSSRHLPGDNCGSRRKGCTTGSYHLIRFHSMAGERGWAEGPVCREPLQAIQKMAERYSQNGEHFRICDVYTEGRPLHLYGHRARLSTFQAPPGNEGLVHLQVRRSVLSMCSSAIRVGTLAIMVHSSHVHLRDGVAKARVSSIGLSRRLPDLPVPVRGDRTTKPLRRCTERDPCPSMSTRLDQTGYQGRMGWIHGRGASWRYRRFRSNEIHCGASQGSESERASHSFITRSKDWTSMGQQEGSANFVRGMRIAHVGIALGALLHSFPLLGYVSYLIQRRTRPVQAQSSSNQRLAVLEKDAIERAYWQASHASSSGSLHAHRRRRCRVWWHLEQRGYAVRSSRPAVLPRHLELARSGAVHHASGAASDSTTTTWKARPSSARPWQIRAASACGQSSGSTHHQQLRFRQSAYDARIATIEIRAGRFGTTHQSRMDTLRCQPIRGRVIATLPPRRLADPQAASAFRAGWYGRSPRRVQVPPIGREPGVPASSNVPRIRSPVEQRGGTATMPPGGSHRSDSSETHDHAGSSDAANPRLASSTVAPSGDTDRQQSDEASPSSGGDMGGAEDLEPRLEASFTRNQPRVTRSSTRMVLAAAADGRVRGMAPGSAAAAMSADLVADYAWSDRTSSTRNSQWRAWMEFCEADGRPPLPVTEAHMVSFVGWLALERQAGRRSVSSTSLPQYFSAVRQMQLVLTGNPVPSFPFLSHVVRGYERWEGEHYPEPTVRMGIDASIVQRIWALGMASTSPSVLRDAAVCVFAFCFNGLRESSVLSIQSSNVALSDTDMTVRLSMWKGQRADRLPLVRYQRLRSISSPVDLWDRWSTARASHVRFFALPGEPSEWRLRGLTRALHNILQELYVAPPQQGKFTSHSLRIGAHTEQILVGIPLKVRYARFGWGPDSQSMAALYFDRTIRVSAASFWVFGHPPVRGYPAATPQSSGALD